MKSYTYLYVSIYIRVKRATGHTHRERTTPPTHTHDRNNTQNPQTNTPHKVRVSHIKPPLISPLPRVFFFFFFLVDLRRKVRVLGRLIIYVSLPHLLNRYSRIPVVPPHKYEYRIPPGKPCIRQEHVPIQDYCFHKTG